MAGAGLSFLPPLSDSVLRYRASTSVYDAPGNLMYATLSQNDEWCIPVSIDKMGKWTPAVAIGVEDRRFYSHGGVDLFAILRAAYQNARLGRVRSGASTIAAQVVRIANPRPRTVRTKLLEFWGAWQLEAQLEKEAILELYLNRAPFGGNLRGVEAASRAYFNKPASALSLAESTLLIGLLRAPSRLRPDRYPLKAKELRDQLLAQLERNGVISREYAEKARLEPMKAARYPMPRRSVLAAKRATRENLPGVRIDSSIDPGAQLALERNLEQALVSLPHDVTAAGIVVDHAKRRVVAYVGNARYDSDSPASQVDCADAPRSPGSTLKPFVYAASFAEGLRTPATLLADTPVAFRGSAPRNYDLTYRGPVSTRLALALSLNAPAVRVLREVGYAKVLDLYRRLGFSYINKNSVHYVDSLVLGGCEVSLSQLAAAYATLASGGRYAELRWTQTLPSEERALFSAEVSFMTIDILRDERRLVPLYQQIFGQEGRAVAFKTGTSYGARDAWTAGCTSNLTIVVWLGDPSGKPHPQLVGLELAAPVALKIMHELAKEGNAKSPIPRGIYTRRVCALSGGLPSEVCPHTIDDYAIKDVSAQAICGLHKLREGRLVTLWPEELKQWVQIRERNDPAEAPVKSVRITRPLNGSKMPLAAEAKSLRLFLSAESGEEQYWYLDGQFVQRSNGDGIFVDAQRGRHKLSVLSGEESDSIEFEIVAQGNTRKEKATIAPILNDER